MSDAQPVVPVAAAPRSSWLVNPMIAKELRQTMRERRGWLLPSLYLLVLSGVVTAIYYLILLRTEPGAHGVSLQGADIGVPLFIALHYVQTTILLLLAPVFSAGGITIEREQGTLTGLLTSLLTPLQIWWGKFVASVLFLLLLLFCSLPVLSLVFALGGVSPRQVVMSTLSTALLLLAVNSFGLYFSSVFRRSVTSTAVTYAAIIGLTVLSLVVYTLIAIWWGSAHPAPPSDRGATVPMPWWVWIPAYFNPYALVTFCLSSTAESWRHWLGSLVAFVAMGLTAGGLTVRRLRRGGEQA